MIAPKSWAVFVARVILGLIFLMAGIWKVFTLGVVEHARNLFVEAYAGTFLPAWSLWLTGVAVPFVEMAGGAMMVAGWKRLAAAVGLGAVLILVTFGHLLAEPLYAFHTHVVPRAILLVVVLAMFDDDALSVDGWLSRRGGGLSTTTALTLFVLATTATPLAAQSGDPAAAPTIDERMLSALRLRGIGPALMSGRIADIAVDPTNRSIWYVATSSSNVWKTENRGTTWTPIFDDYPAMGGLWAPGGDRGLFKTTDGGENWAPVLEIPASLSPVPRAGAPVRSRSSGPRRVRFVPIQSTWGWPGVRSLSGTSRN